MKIAISGPNGFLAWHMRCALAARQEQDVVAIGRPEFQSRHLMDAALYNADSVVHLAGVNRAPDQEIASLNPTLARLLAEGIARAHKPITVVYANSIQSHGNSIFGRAKAEAAAILRSTCEKVGGPFVNVILPNVFGEHGQPFYNSVTATFCHQLATGKEPEIQINRDLQLMHAQAVAELLLHAAAKPNKSDFPVEGQILSVSDLLRKLREISGPYLEGRLPDLSDSFTRDLFNTYRSHTFPAMWPILPVKHADARGELVESVRGAGGETQVFFSRTKPGFTRGNHFHLRKVERFMVLEGDASIKLRRLFTDEVIEFKVSGETPAIIDMPTMWTHSITNIGNKDLLTLFYADDQYNPDDPDTYWVDV